MKISRYFIYCFLFCLELPFTGKGQLRADFTSDNNKCSGTNILFSSSVSGGTAPYTYFWHFGDGAAWTSSNDTTFHVFTAIGCGTATLPADTLIVTDANGLSFTVFHQRQVIRAPDVQLRDVDIFSPFSNCDNSPTIANPNFTLTVNNISPSANCIDSYSIDWEGDGNSQPVGTFPVSHTYNKLGAFNLVVTAIGSNGCSNSKTYTVANQSNPDIGIGTFGPTEGCAPLPVSIVITTWQGNSTGTTYLLNYGDGSSTAFTHPINTNNTNDTIYHTYTKSPCPSASGFPLTITATNACRSKSFTGGDIQVKTKPQANFSSANSSCTGQSICFTNQTGVGYYTNCSTNTAYAWDFGDPASGSNNTSNATNPCHTFSNPGTYTVTLTTSNPCGSSTFSKQVCITAPIIPSFTLIDTSGCAPFSINANNTSSSNSCSPTKYKWTISYAAAFCGTSSSWGFVPPYTDTSVSPSFIFNNPGVYTIGLVVIGPVCSSTIFTKQITVKSKPSISFIPVTIPATICQNVSINPRASYNCIYPNTTYDWKFPLGEPNFSPKPIPDPVFWPMAGPDTISLTVTNECGASTITRPISVIPRPDIFVPADTTVCAGIPTGPFIFSSEQGVTFGWTNNNTAIGLATSGTGNIPSFIAKNPTSAPITATITVTASPGGCPSLPKSFTITVKPGPVKPTVVKPPDYCLNDIASPLVATPALGNTLTWYMSYPLTNGSPNAPTPSTSSAGTTLYYVTQTGTSDCASDTSIIRVKVSPLITGNTIASDQNLCSPGSAPAPLVQATGIIVGGGAGPNSYSYQWQLSIDGGATWTDINGGTSSSYAPGIILVTSAYRRKISSGGCSDTSNVVTISLGSLANTEIFSPQAICEGSTPALLTGETPIGGNGTFTYQWERSLDNNSWAPIPGATSQNYQPPALSITTYYRRKTSSVGCSAYSSSLKISVYKKPVAGNITPAINNVCAGSNVRLTSVSTDSIIKWQYNPAPINDNIWHDSIFTTSSITFNNVQDTFAVRLIVISFGFGKGCNLSDTSNAALVNVSPKPVGGSTNADSTVCSGTNTGTIDLTGHSGSIARWEFSINSGTTWNSVSNTTSSLTYRNLTTETWYRVVIEGGSCPNGYSNTTKIKVTNTGPPANAGLDQKLCNQSSTNLSGNNTSFGVGKWTQISGPPAMINNPNLNNTLVTGLLPDTTYHFLWTITGIGICDNSSDEVEIINRRIPAQINVEPDKLCAPSTLKVNAANASNASRIEWVIYDSNTPPGEFYVTGPTASHLYNVAGTYSVKLIVHTMTGCTDDTSYQFQVFNTPKISFQPHQISTCSQDTTVRFIANTSNTGGDPVNYKWFVNDQLKDITNPFIYRFQAPLNNTAPVQFKIQALAVNAAGCGDTSLAGKLIIQPLPASGIVVSPALIQQQPDYTFTFKDTVATNPNKNYLWDMGDRSLQTRSGREVTYTYGDTGKYKVKLLVTDFSTGCKASDSIHVTILHVPGYLHVPNAMCMGCSNNTLRQFLPLGKGLAKYRLRILTGWGQVIFATTLLNADGSPEVPWDGTVNGKILQQDVYRWEIEATYSNGTEWKGMLYPGKSRPVKTGFITIIK